MSLVFYVALTSYIFHAREQQQRMARKWSLVALLFAVAILGATSQIVHVEEQIEDETQFESLENMLQWAIKNSDGDALSKISKQTPEELAQRREEIQDFLASMKMPTNVELMQIAINDLQNTTTSTEERLRALQELIELVEPIDNANDLDKLGGLKAIVNELESSETELRTAAAWALGKACQNNPTVQEQAFDHNTLSDFLGSLMEMVNSKSEKEALKSFFALSALLRNNPTWQERFFSQGGEKLLRKLLDVDVGTKLRQKCINLVSDLASEPDSKYSRIARDINDGEVTFSKDLTSGFRTENLSFVKLNTM